MAPTTVSAGKGIHDFNVIIEISANGGEVKYEYDKELQILTVDRFMLTSMRYPCNYGFVPSTLGEDGDPLDVLVLTPAPIQPGTLIRVRAVGMMKMEDESGNDSKILAVPLVKACREYEYIQSLKDVSPLLLDNIACFFEHYKELEPNKWAKVKGWFEKSEAKEEFEASFKRLQE
ncbi:MAG: inorganic diphosphatase [Coxiella-like endosymbiont]|uniref:inorganic diphosphatase n=1 Tax=Coxiella-like endosymbiont TaxID=1592897 RepID=UPI00215AAD70|nr:inorganic diphosphatase [Coxiella-like endosymbiont]UVE59492.1 inorganic diphosphatase [Coxiella-like endosymbiont]